MDGESPQAYMRFLAYRDLPVQQRSVRKTAAICGISDRLCSKWCKQWSWPKRALAYDGWKTAVMDRCGIVGAIKQRDRAVAFGTAAVEFATQSLKHLPHKLKVDDIVTLADKGDEIARRALDLDRVQATPQASVSVGFIMPDTFGVDGFKPAWMKPAQHNIMALSGSQQAAENKRLKALSGREVTDAESSPGEQPSGVGQAPAELDVVTIEPAKAPSDGAPDVQAKVLETRPAVSARAPLGERMIEYKGRG
jgi:hypothetical protein